MLVDGCRPTENQNREHGKRREGGASALMGGKRGVNEQAGTQNTLLHVLTINLLVK